MARMKRTNATDDGILWPDPKKGPWYIAGHWTEIDGKPECVGLELWKTVMGAPDLDNLIPIKGQKPAGIGGVDLRTIPLASVLDALWELQRATEARQVELIAGVVSDLESGEAKARDQERAISSGKAFVASADQFQHPTRRSTDDLEHFKAVAGVYLEATRAPRPRPTKAVQDTFHVSHSTATKWVAKARKHGLIPSTTAGRPSTTTKKKGS